MAFESLKDKRNRTPRNLKEPELQGDLRRARAFGGGAQDVRGLDTKTADIDMRNIWADANKRETFRDLGIAMHGAGFTELFGSMMGGADLDDAARGIREEVRAEFNNRMATSKACEKLMTPDLFAGLDAGHPAVGRIVAAVGPTRALTLMKGRLLNMVREQDGGDRLLDLHRSLQEMHDLYNVKNYRKVTGRIESIQKKYNLTPEEYTDFTRDANMFETAGRVRRDLSRELGWFGRIKHFVPDYMRGLRVGFAGWRERRSGALEELRQWRAHTLGVVMSTTLDPQFFDTVDREILSGRWEEEQRVEGARRVESNAATELSMENETVRRDSAWAQHVFQNRRRLRTPQEREQEYDQWFPNQYVPAGEQEVQNTPGVGAFIAAILQALFRARVRRMPRPSFA